MKIACVLVTHFPAKAETLRRPELRGRAVIIASGSGGGAVALDASAHARGVHPGMALQTAVSLCKDAMLIEADLPYYGRAFDRMIEALTQRSPRVERGEQGCAFVDVGGLDAMYGGEAGVTRALLNATPDHFNARVGLASCRFPAYVAAISSAGGQATRAPDDAATFLRNFSTALLPISWESRRRLQEFGLRAIGQIADMPLSAVQAQLGPDGRLAWELANGIDTRPFVTETPSDSISDFISFPTPAVSMSAILPALDALLGRALSHPQLRGKYVRSVVLESEIVGRANWSKRFAFKSPVSDRSRALLALKRSFESDEMPGPLENLRLTVSEVSGESGTQSGLFVETRKRDQLRESMSQLEERLRDKPPIYRVVDVEPWSRIPERRQALVEFVP